MYSASRQRGILNVRQATSLLVRLVLEERWEVPNHPQVVLPQNLDGAQSYGAYGVKNYPLATMYFLGLDLILLLIRWRKL
ncbi:hypothetical protein TNCV_911681 [Trichonephila clavipes]|nr:hypothetical protein TNCV_911681 [Trichonephila clavipes]